MDSVDRIILERLKTNCRISLQELATKTRVSANEVRKRIDILLTSGVIRNFTTLLCPQMTNEEQVIAILDFETMPDEKLILKALTNSQSVWKVNRSLEDKYVVVGIYFDRKELTDLTLLLRSLEGIREVEMHSRFLRYWGGKVDLTEKHRQILRCLLVDARMSVADIAKQTGLPSNTVNQTIKEMRESEAVLFTTNTSDYMMESKTEVLAKIQWNVGKTSHEHVLKWLQDEFPSAYLREFVSVTEPTLFFKFTVNHVQEVEFVRQKANESGLISIIDSLILFSGTLFPDPRQRRLSELLTETGFSIEDNSDSPFR